MPAPKRLQSSLRKSRRLLDSSPHFALDTKSSPASFLGTIERTRSNQRPSDLPAIVQTEHTVHGVSKGLAIHEPRHLLDLPLKSSLHYAGISYTPIPVPIKNVSLEFTKTNPKGQIPVLMLDGEMITENPAIAQAINHLAPSANIMGSKPIEFIRVCEWMNFLSASIHAQVWGAWMRPYRFTDEPEGKAGVKRQALTKLRDRFAHLESKLPASGWAVGDGFTAVDAYLIHASQWAERAGISIETDYPKWAALMKKVRAEELVQQALAEEEQIGRIWLLCDCSKSQGGFS